MTKEEVKKIIEEQTITLGNCGIDKWPGYFMRLDSEQIEIQGKIIDIDLLAWYELTKEGDQPKCTNGFVIDAGKCKYIFLDWFHEARAVWDYYLETYPTS